MVIRVIEQKKSDPLLPPARRRPPKVFNRLQPYATETYCLNLSSTVRARHESRATQGWARGGGSVTRRRGFVRRRAASTSAAKLEKKNEPDHSPSYTNTFLRRFRWEVGWGVAGVDSIFAAIREREGARSVAVRQGTPHKKSDGEGAVLSQTRGWGGVGGGGVEGFRGVRDQWGKYGWLGCGGREGLGKEEDIAKQKNRNRRRRLRAMAAAEREKGGERAGGKG